MPRPAPLAAPLAALLAGLLLAPPLTVQEDPAADRAADRPGVFPVDSWAKRLKQIRSAPPARYGIGAELVTLDPDFALAIVRECWPGLANDAVKTGVMTAFLNAEQFGAEGPHPHLLRVLDLGITDGSGDVRADAARRLEPMTFQDFAANPGAYAAFREKYVLPPGDGWAAALRRDTRPKLREKLDALTEQIIADPDRGDLWDAAGEIDAHGDPWAVPHLIGLIAAYNDEYDVRYGLGWYGLRRLTGVRYEDEYDGAWWRTWWAENRERFPEDVRDLPIPEHPRVRQAKIEHETAEREGRPAPDAAAPAAPAAPAERRTAAAHERMEYFEIGPPADAEGPEDGFGLVLVLPGGDGGPDFLPWVRTLYRESAPEGFLFAELIAPDWTGGDENRVVWPTSVLKQEGMGFTTEAFVDAVVADIAGRRTIDPAKVFTLSWSSGGPAAYVASFDSERVKGSFVAMSVFREDWLPPLDAAAGQLYYLYQSPDDAVTPFGHAERAAAVLKKAGAEVELKRYPGGHGWQSPDRLEHVREGLSWLTERAAAAAAGDG